MPYCVCYMKKFLGNFLASVLVYNPPGGYLRVLVRSFSVDVDVELIISQSILCYILPEPPVQTVML